MNLTKYFNTKFKINKLKMAKKDTEQNTENGKKGKDRQLQNVPTKD